jgi:hypothetical protein
MQTHLLAGADVGAAKAVARERLAALQQAGQRLRERVLA